VRRSAFGLLFSKGIPSVREFLHFASSYEKYAKRWTKDSLAKQKADVVDS
jgi:hypothetical protein